MMKYLLEEISLFINNLLSTQLPPSFVYHNLSHTLDVVDYTKLISANYNLSQEEKDLLLIAAWFHDTGYIKETDNHEKRSVEIAEVFLGKRHIPAEQINIVSKLILSTKVPQNPETLTENILCDADLAYLGSDSLKHRNELLRKEWEITLNRFYTDKEWLQQNINFIGSNNFHTDFAKEKFGEIRNKNLAELKKKLAEIENS